MKVVHALSLFALFLLLPLDLAKAQDVLTYHNDLARTGQYLSEATLTPANVNATSFGLLFQLTVDGKVDGQPLYAAAVSRPNGVHNLAIVVTENDSVYAFDADTGTAVWQASALGPGETAAAANCGEITPTIGITSTPVIDRGRGPHGAIYVVAMSQSSTTYYQRLHALDLATGAELFGGPETIQATYPGTGDSSAAGSVAFVPAQYKERAALLLLNGAIYTTWSSQCDTRPYTSWVIAFDAGTLAPAAILNLTPNGFQGGIWMSGAGPAADAAGNVYFAIGNGDFGATLNAGGFPANSDYGNAVVKLSTSPGLAVADYFTEYNQILESDGDIDLGSGGTLLLPDMQDASGTTRHLAAAAGKDGNIYILNRDSMGKYNANANDIYQELPGVLAGGIWSMPAYFNNRLYFGSVGSPIRAFQFSSAVLSATAVAQTPGGFEYPGATPSISANGGNNAILWAAENTNPAILHAYDANTLTELYNSSQAAAGRDNFGTGNRFVTPTIANGKVYVPTTTGVGVFGLLTASVVPPALSPAPGAFNTAQSVTLSDATAGATIYYTTDGTIPTTSSAVYSGPIPISSTTTVTAFAAVGTLTSTLTTGVYTLETGKARSGAAQWAGLGGSFTSRIAVGTDSDGRLDVFVRGTDHTLWHNAQATPGGAWSGWQGLGGWLISDPVVAANADGRLEVFALGGDGSLWHVAQSSPGSAVWAAWAGLGGSLTGDPAVALNADGRLEVLARGANNALMDISQSAAGSSTWSGWTSLGGVLGSNPAIAAEPGGALDVFVLGSDSTLWHISQASPGGAWAGWSGLGGSLSGDPVLAVNNDGRLEIFAQGADNALWHNAQSTAGGAWSGFSSLGSSISGNPAVALNTDGTLEVFAVGSDKALWHIWQTTPGANWSPWASFGGALNGQPGAGRDANGCLTAFGQGTDTALYAIAQTAAGSWN